MPACGEILAACDEINAASGEINVASGEIVAERGVIETERGLIEMERDETVPEPARALLRAEMCSHSATGESPRLRDKALHT